MVGRNSEHRPHGNTARDDRRRALEAKLYSGETVSADELGELRALVAPPATRHEPTASPDDAAPDATSDAARPSRVRPARAWLAAGAIAVVVAGLAGAGISASVAGSRTSPDPPASTATHGASSPATGLRSGAIAESLGSEYFDQAQTPGDHPDVVLPGIDPSTTRRVLAQWGDQDGEAGVWVARGKDDSFCLIMSVGTTRGASSCTPLEDAATTGVRLDLVTAGGATISADWNLAAGLLELTPFPVQTDGARSGTPSPKP